MSTKMKSEASNWGRYKCPLDGSTLFPTENQNWWICPHYNGDSASHETRLAYDVQLGETVEYLVKGKTPVALD